MVLNRLTATSVAALLGVLASGCFDYFDNCELALTCPRGTGGTGGGDAGPPPGCIPSKSKDPVADACGVFVSVTGDDGAAGTKAKPLKTIQAALAKGSTIYACAGTSSFTEAVTIGKAVTLFGALDCAGWGYDASKKTQLTAAADAVPLTLTSAASGSEVRDFAIGAADAAAAGGSSIAVLDDHADLALENVDVTAGVGAAGAAGDAQAQVMTPAMASGSPGTDDPTCNVPGSISGGLGGKNMCDGMTTGGGIGGTGIADVAGGDGSGGKPVMTPSNGGVGQTNGASCKPGQPGIDGGPGTAGTGARGIGDISASGYQAASGALGMSGVPGQGGGGGGGARQCDVNGMFAGPSGGGGGAGGCAGAPGKPGQGGGSSIGILALGAKLTLATVTLTTKDGGKGGGGGNGQPGGTGGQQGNQGGSGACPGGPGGQGGAGGPGGGGSGGHSAAIVVKGGQLPDLASTTIMHGNGAAGGTGGDMDLSAQTKGDDGLGCKALDFTDPQSMACAK
jgi:hypothetical protein